MRVFVITHDGEWLPGYTVYIGDEQPTPKQIREHLAKHYTLRDVSKMWIQLDDIRELKPGMNLVWDGDY